MPEYSIIRETDSQDLAAAVLAYSYTMTKDGWLEWVGIGFDVACSQVVTITIVPVEGAAYTFVAKTTTLSSATSYFYKESSGPIELKLGDVVQVGITTGGASVASMTASFKERPTLKG